MAISETIKEADHRIEGFHSRRITQPLIDRAFCCCFMPSAPHIYIQSGIMVGASILFDANWIPFYRRRRLVMQKAVHRFPLGTAEGANREFRSRYICSFFHAVFCFDVRYSKWLKSCWKSAQLIWISNWNPISCLQIGIMEKIPNVF